MKKLASLAVIGCLAVGLISCNPMGNDRNQGTVRNNQTGQMGTTQNDARMRNDLRYREIAPGVGAGGVMDRDITDVNIFNGRTGSGTGVGTGLGTGTGTGGTTGVVGGGM